MYIYIWYTPFHMMYVCAFQFESTRISTRTLTWIYLTIAYMMFVGGVVYSTIYPYHYIRVRVHMFYCENLTKLLQFAIFIQTEINYSKEISIINSNSFQHILIWFFYASLVYVISARNFSCCYSSLATFSPPYETFVNRLFFSLSFSLCFYCAL